MRAAWIKIWQQCQIGKKMRFSIHPPPPPLPPPKRSADLKAKFMANFNSTRRVVKQLRAESSQKKWNETEEICPVPTTDADWLTMERADAPVKPPIAHRWQQRAATPHRPGSGGSPPGQLRSIPKRFSAVLCGSLRFSAVLCGSLRFAAVRCGFTS